MDAAQSLKQHGLLGHFEPPVEADYRRWFALKIRPVLIAMPGITFMLWAAAPIAAQFLFSLSSTDRAVIYGVCWGVHLPLLGLGTWYVWRAQAPRVVLFGVIGIAVTCVDMIAVLGPVTHVSAGTYLTGAIFSALLGPLVHLPFRPSLALAVLMTGLGHAEAIKYADHWTASLTITTGFLYAGALLVGPAMALATERWLRSNYVSEQTIAQQRQLIRRYAPSSVASRVELGDTSVDAPQRRKVTVFFSDVVGFTEMADRVDPEALAAIVNDYLGSLADLIERHGGTLNEFAGDGVMAIFGAPDEMDPVEQVAAAVAAARELQASLPEWSQDWYQHGILEDAKARIGINTGTISVGTFGSIVRATYTGIGLQTNITARVQAQADPGGILLSNTSWHLVKDTIACEPRGEVMVKGVHFPIELYEPVAS